MSILRDSTKSKSEFARLQLLVEFPMDVQGFSTLLPNQNLD